MIALVTYATFGAPGVGGTFFVVVSDGTVDYVHRATFSWSYAGQKRRAQEAAERLAERVREARVTVEHCAARPEFWECATSYSVEEDGSWTPQRTWAREIETAFASTESHA